MVDLGKDLVKNFLDKKEARVEKVAPGDVLGPNGEVAEYTVETPDGTVWSVGEIPQPEKIDVQIENVTITLGAR